jgi:hypothetical protein
LDGNQSHDGAHRKENYDKYTLLHWTFLW